MLFHLALARTPSSSPMIVELAALAGKTSMLLAAGLRAKSRPRLLSVQRPSRTADEAAADLAWRAVHRNIQRCGLGHVFEEAAVDSRAIATDWKDPIDILFINATQDYDTLREDLSLWAPFVRPHGIVAVHGLPSQFPVPLRDIFEDLQLRPYADFRQVDTLAWALKRRAAPPVPLPPTITPETAPATCYVDREAENAHVAAELEQLDALLTRSLEAMLRLNPVPAVLKLDRYSSRNEHLEDKTEIAIARMQDYVRRATDALAKNRHDIEALRRSWSWRITAPLRFAIDTVHVITGLLRSLASGSPKARIMGLAQWMWFGRQVRASGLFDGHYYREHYGGLNWAWSGPMLHFFVCGADERKKPNELFDVDYYLGLYPDVAASGVNPLVHYLRMAPMKAVIRIPISTAASIWRTIPMCAKTISIRWRITWRPASQKAATLTLGSTLRSTWSKTPTFLPSG